MKKIIWVMWWGENASEIDMKNAYEIWNYIAWRWFVTLTWWRNVWVMDRALKWAKENWWLTLWILWSSKESICSEYLDIPIFTNMKSGRNYINALTSNIIVACWVELWTSSEISLWLKSWKKVVIIWAIKEANDFYKLLWENQTYIASDYNEAINIINELI